MNKKYKLFVRLLPVFLLLFVSSCPQKPEPSRRDKKEEMPHMQFPSAVNVFPPPVDKSPLNRPDFAKLYEPETYKKTFSHYSEPSVHTEGFCNQTKLKGVIYISFSDQMVEWDKVGKKASPPISINPPGGMFIWESPDILRFHPAGPFSGEMKYQVSVPKDLKSIKGGTLKKAFTKTATMKSMCNIGGKIIEWEPIIGKPQIAGLNGCSYWGNNILTKDGQCVYFDQSVSAKFVKEKIVVTVNGVKNPYLLREQYSKDSKFERGQAYQIIPKGPFKPGTKIVFTPDKSIASHGQTTPGKFRDNWFITTLTMPKPMEALEPSVPKSGGTVKKISKNKYELYNLGFRFYLKFTNEIQGYSKKEFERLITITPRVNLTFENYGSKIFIFGDLDPNKQYTVHVSNRLQDQYGYYLKEPQTIILKPRPLLPSFKYAFNKSREKTKEIEISTVNVSDFTLNVYPLTKQNIIKGLLLAETGKGSIADIPFVKLEKNKIVKDNKVKLHNFSLKDHLKEKLIGPVLYTLANSVPKINQPASEEFRKHWLLQFTQMGCSVKILPDELIVWLTNITTGAHVSGAELSVYDEKGKLLHTKKSDEHGVVLIKEKNRLIATRLYFIIEHKNHLAYHIHKKEKTIANWRFKIPQSGINSAGYNPAMIFTERGAYNPGETVFFKALIRKGSGEDMVALTGEKVTVGIFGPYDEKIDEKVLNLNEFGTVSGSFKTIPTFQSGSHTLKVFYNKNNIASTTVQVTAFRKPKFRVNITTEKSSYINGGQVPIQVESRYLFGSPMGSADLTFFYFLSKGKFVPDGYAKFSFNPLDNYIETPYPNSWRETLSSDGKYNINKSLKFNSKGTLNVIFQADVQDIDRQTVSRTSNITVHPAAHYAGVRIVDLEPKVGKPTKFEAVTLDHKGNLLKGKPMKVQIHRRTYTWYWESDGGDDNQSFYEGYRNKLVTECKIIRTGEKFECRHIFKEPGLYEVVAQTKDSKGNISEGAMAFYVIGEGESALGRSTFVPMNLILDKNIYTVGEEGKVLLSSPFNKAKVLLTVENHGILYRQVHDVKKGVNRISFPVPSGAFPNGYVSAYLLTPRTTDKKDGAGRDLGVSQFRVGYAALRTTTNKHNMGVKITTSKEKARPGDQVDINIALTSPEGNPVSGEVALMVVDESVLSLTDFQTPDPKKDVFRKIGFRVRISDSRTEIEGELKTLYSLTHPGGGPDISVYEVPKIKDSVRKTFKNTLYFNPSLVTDAQGKVTTTITLPDNVTTYRIMAVAIDKKFLFGSSSKEITVNKPLMIEPALPRFLISGDKIKAGVVAHNMTTKPVKATVTIEATGIKLLSTPRTSVIIHPQKPVEIPFDMKADTIGQAHFTFSVKTETGESDKVQTSIPVNPFIRSRIHVATGMTYESHSLTLDFPETTLKEGMLSLEVTSNPLTTLKESIDYLIKYPYGCVEQTTSSTYPLLALMDILPTLGSSEHTPEKLKAMAQKGIERFLKMTVWDGGLAYWPGGNNSHPYGTAYAMLAINAAAEKGLQMPLNFRNRIGVYLAKVLKESVESNVNAYIIYVLSQIKKHQSSYISNLYKDRNKLNIEAKSWLYMAMNEANNNDPRLETLLNEIVGNFDENGNVIPKKPQKNLNTKTDGQEYRNYGMFGSPMKTLSVVLMALLYSDKYVSLSQKLVTKILASQKNGYFGTTQQTSFALMALVAFAKKHNIGSQSPIFKVTLDGKPLQFVSVGKTVYTHKFDFPSVIAKGKQKLTITSLKKGKPVFFTLKTKFSETPQKDYVSAYSSGISVYKRIEDVKGKTALEVEGGKLVRVRLFVHIPQSNEDIKYLVIDDPLPSGLEAINTDLETSAKVATGKETGYKLANKTKEYISFREFREDRVLFFADSINSGFWEFTYLARATTIGSGFVPPVSAHAMYDPETHASSNPSRLTVKSNGK
ncbi:hypothetical protein KKF34_19775 [Myxococcota bacterium]|nr:hypothetical protein [Myxococcota bacterium]MBU1381061.1 hypothetical protein [Myxococcota bacterium]MBU1499128.1 hypothetical protein [Myxococcota bacterium]